MKKRSCCAETLFGDAGMMASVLGWFGKRGQCDGCRCRTMLTRDDDEMTSSEGRKGDR